MADSRGLLYADLQLPKTSNNGSMKVKNHNHHHHHTTSTAQHQWPHHLNRSNFSDRTSLDQTLDTLDTSLDRSHSKVEDV